MPQLIIKGIPLPVIKACSNGLVDDLSLIIGCPRDHFTLEVPQTAYIFDGEESTGYPLIQINWFDRSQEVQDKAALAITRHFQQVGIEFLELYFIALKQTCYYENGCHY